MKNIENSIYKSRKTSKIPAFAQSSMSFPLRKFLLYLHSYTPSTFRHLGKGIAANETKPSFNFVFLLVLHVFIWEFSKGGQVHNCSLPFESNRDAFLRLVRSCKIENIITNSPHHSESH